MLTTLPPSCGVMKSGNLNFLETSGPLQACNGTALPLYIYIYICIYIYISISYFLSSKLFERAKMFVPNPQIRLYFSHFVFIPYEIRD